MRALCGQAMIVTMIVYVLYMFMFSQISGLRGSLIAHARSVHGRELRQRDHRHPQGAETILPYSGFFSLRFVEFSTTTLEFGIFWSTDVSFEVHLYENELSIYRL